MKRVLLLIAASLGATSPLAAQLIFSGGSLFSSNASGGQAGGYIWETTAGGFSNLYFFTGTPASPLPYLNSGNTSDKLDTNYTLTAGTHEIYFVGNEVPGTSYVGLNLYFDHDFTATNNRISAVVTRDGASTFSAISGASTGYGQTSLVAGSGSLSYTAGGFSVTLSDLHMETGTYDLVGATATGANGTNDVVGHMTLTVTAVPEPSTVALFCGVAALGAATWRRRVVARRVSGGTT